MNFFSKMCSQFETWWRGCNLCRIKPFANANVNANVKLLIRNEKAQFESG